MNNRLRRTLATIGECFDKLRSAVGLQSRRTGLHQSASAYHIGIPTVRLVARDLRESAAQLHGEPAAQKLQARIRDVVAAIDSYLKRNFPPVGASATLGREAVGSALEMAEAELDTLSRSLSVDQEVESLQVQSLSARQASNQETSDSIEPASSGEIQRASGQSDANDGRAGKGRPTYPENPDVRDLCAELAREAGKGKTEIALARDFTEGNEKKAKSLLRQARRYKHLWKPGRR